VPSAERGIALLEVMAAVVILSAAGLGAVGIVHQETASFLADRDREFQARDEDRLLAAHALLSGPELALRLGVRMTGPYQVNIERPRASLFRIAVSRAGQNDAEDLVTVVYRPEVRHAR
jgi:Tfp pilus assembly protein PilV